MFRKCRGLVGMILLFFFLGQFFDSTLFTHTHIIDGVLIVHSHPFNILEKHHHQHSKEQLVVIYRITHAVFTAPATLTPISPIFETVALPKIRKIVSPDIYLIVHASLRAPPFC